MTLATAILTSHSPRSRLSTLAPDRTARTIFDPVTLSGTVTYDRRREVRRTARLTLVDIDASLAPTAYGDELAQGELIRLERGARIAGVDDHQLLGVFEVTDFEASLSGSLSISAEDPAVVLRQAFGEVVVIPAQTSAAEAVRLLWEPVLGDGSGWALDGAGMGITLTRTLREEDERLHAAVALMADLGLELYMSRDGYPVLTPQVDPNTLPISHTYRQIPGEALATDIRRRGERMPYNRQIVIGESPSGEVIRSVLDITDPASPVHADRIGLRLAPIHRSAGITTQHQADVVCRAMLIEAATWSDSLAWVGVPDPTVEAGEVIAFVDPTSGTDALYRVEAVTIPVTTGGMSIEGTRVLPMFLS